VISMLSSEGMVVENSDGAHGRMGKTNAGDARRTAREIVLTNSGRVPKVVR
jgi:hypothetical protein